MKTQNKYQLPFKSLSIAVSDKLAHDGEMNPTVLVIDMQDYPIDYLFSPARKVLITSQLEVLDYCAKNDIPVVIVEYFNKGNITTSPILLDKCSQVPRTRKVTKYAFDAFCNGSNPNFNGVLNELDSDYLALMGVSASICVRATASSAVKRGYTIGTSLDLIADSAVRLDNGFFVPNHCIEFYQQIGDVFRTHQELIKHLEGMR